MTDLLARLTQATDAMTEVPPPGYSGQVLRYDGLILECAGFPASPGTRCLIDTEDGKGATGEIVGFANGRNLLFLDQPGARITHGCQVHKMRGGHNAAMGDALLGRVLDAEGAPLDGFGPPDCPARSRGANRTRSRGNRSMPPLM